MNGYKPTRVVEHFKSTVVRGIIVKIRLRKHKFLFFYSNKDIYCWLPYKSAIDSYKYGIIGAPKRDPYANAWFEIKTDCEIYEQGLSDFVLRQKKLKKTTNELRIQQPFLSSELLLITRKDMIRLLDAYVFPNKRNIKK